ncbi:hypothetical protein O3P69_016628 [Scylla paramamosain]|uniref:Uncharacterized protein n=1 Tax=Scylla paramamosain TaxID=85552 RepID=A0AAW0SXP2_SCYPA
MHLSVLEITYLEVVGVGESVREMSKVCESLVAVCRQVTAETREQLSFGVFGFAGTCVIIPSRTQRPRPTCGSPGPPPASALRIIPSQSAPPPPTWRENTCQPQIHLSKVTWPEGVSGSKEIQLGIRSAPTKPPYPCLRRTDLYTYNTSSPLHLSPYPMLPSPYETLATRRLHLVAAGKPRAAAEATS